MRSAATPTRTRPTAALNALPRSAFDLLVTDYNMPGFCGVDLVREARLIRPDLPVALASGYVTAEIEQAALAEGAQALIHKPNDVEELCATVQRLVGGDSHDRRLKLSRACCGHCRPPRPGGTA